MCDFAQNSNEKCVNLHINLTNFVLENPPTVVRNKTITRDRPSAAPC